MKRLAYPLILALMLVTVVYAACPANNIEDCNLLNQTACESGLYFGNTTGINESCTWNIALCEEDGLNCDTTTTTTTTSTTTTTLPPGSCDASEMKINWHVIGITESFKEQCFYFSNGTLLKCYKTNDTICLPRTLDYQDIIVPSNWDIIENPVNATTWILGLGRPTVGIAFVVLIVLIFGWVFIRLVFRPMFKR